MSFRNRKLEIKRGDPPRDLFETLGTDVEGCSAGPVNVTGKAPRSLSGVLHRNGPGKFRRGGTNQRDVLHGDGVIQRLDLTDGRARYARRFVRTPKVAAGAAANGSQRAFGIQQTGVAIVNPSSLHRSQWEGYSRYHQSRLNLLLHIVFVPLFLASNVVLLVALIECRWLLGLETAALTGLSLAIQGRGHNMEAVPAEPFMGPFNAISRIALEQWVTFPRFVLSGAWKRALRKRSTP